MNVGAFAECGVLLKPANAKGIISQEHSCMDGMSSMSADRTEPEEQQISGSRITGESPGIAADVTACKGTASDKIRVHRVRRVIFLTVDESK
jgi:hypothetical protein